MDEPSRKSLCCLQAFNILFFLGAFWNKFTFFPTFCAVIQHLTVTPILSLKSQAHFTTCFTKRRTYSKYKWHVSNRSLGLIIDGCFYSCGCAKPGGTIM